RRHQAVRDRARGRDHLRRDRDPSAARARGHAPDGALELVPAAAGRARAAGCAGGSANLIAERLTAQLLAGEPAGAPVAVAERLLAVQAQDPRGARLAVRARTVGVTAADVERALTEERSLLVTWLNRGTLHLVRSEDYAWLHALTTPPLATGCARR